MILIRKIDSRNIEVNGEIYQHDSDSLKNILSSEEWFDNKVN